MQEIENKPERALLVAVDTGEYDTQASLAELYELTRSAGAEPAGSVVQKRPPGRSGNLRRDRDAAGDRRFLSKRGN